MTAKKTQQSDTPSDPTVPGAPPAPPPDPPPPAPVPPRAAPPARRTEPAEVDEDPTLVAETNGNRTPEAKLLLLDACALFGINPKQATRPKELLAWRFYAGSDIDGVPDSVVVVTAGGRKLRWYEDPDYPMDPETEERLAYIFRSFEIDPVTKMLRRKALPVDKALPSESVDGKVRVSDHLYRGGYLKSGGSQAAESKEDARKRRMAERSMRHGEVLG